jgi:hypothetical protein
MTSRWLSEGQALKAQFVLRKHMEQPTPNEPMKDMLAACRARNTSSIWPAAVSRGILMMLGSAKPDNLECGGVMAAESERDADMTSRATTQHCMNCRLGS